MAAFDRPAVRASHLKGDLRALDVELAEAVHAEAGEEGPRLRGTTSFLHSLDGIFEPLFIGRTKVIGPLLGQLLRALPWGWLTAEATWLVDWRALRS